MNALDRMDFEQAMGEEFAECLTPPLPFEEASSHECCEVIWTVLGDGVDPQMLAAATADQIAALAAEFGSYFEVGAPSGEQIISAIDRTLRRWPANPDL